MSTVIWHNPRCGTSRNTLAMIRASGVEPTVINYLTVGWDRATLKTLAEQMGEGLKGLLRAKEPGAAGLTEASDDAVLDAMVADPVLVERPIVQTPKGVRLCRPSEQVFGLLDNPPDSFTKEDGEVVRS